MGPRQACGALGRRRPLLGRLGNCFTFSLSRPCLAPLASGFQTLLNLAGQPSSFLDLTAGGLWNIQIWVLVSAVLQTI